MIDTGRKWKINQDPIEMHTILVNFILTTRYYKNYGQFKKKNFKQLQQLNFQCCVKHIAFGYYGLQL